MSKHVDLPPGPTPLESWQRFAVYVLWCKGLTVKQISVFERVTVGQVQNTIQRSPYRNRTTLTIEERQQMLDDLKTAWAEIGNRGGLVEADFRALDLSWRQR